MVNIAIVNESTVCTDAEVQSWISALQTQVSQHFAPIWGADAKLSFVGKGGVVDPADWQLAILDNSDQAGALGYHDMTATGQPLGKIFAASDKQYGNSVSVTTSHELLEMLGDPGINMCVTSQDSAGNQTLIAYEACDACEADQYGYKIGDVLVSDFVYPDWFGGVAGKQYDYCSKLAAPFPKILPGGYIGVWTPATGWTQITGELAIRSYKSRSPVGSRRERRTTPKPQWLPSNNQ
jgi:hypothetical protein